jgi:crotonobetainyl-CoA:carnitine CoA-transferase CaiB-like acyl-CoA transferase
MIGVANDNLWRKFCAVTGLDAIVDDPRFRTNADRVAHRTETIGHVQSAIAQHSVAYWNDTLAGVRVPCASINTIAQLLDHPHTSASGIVVEYEHQIAGRLKGVGHPVLIDGAKRQAGLPPPMLGQHTDDVLGEMGLSSEIISELRRARVIG